MHKFIFLRSALLMCGVNTACLYKINSVDNQMQRVKVESIMSSGKAIYMPGNVCVLKATSDIPVDKMRDFASACVQSHKNWLLINAVAPNYSNGNEDIQK